MKPILYFLIAVLLLTPTAKAVVIDNSASMQGSKAVGDIDWGYEAFKSQLKAQGKDSGINGFLGFAIIDPPRGLGDYQAEYRASGGGPMLQSLGVSGFTLQNGLVKALMGVLLSIFVAASILQGIHKGEINYVTIALKFLLGVFVVFNPPFVYGVGRTMQTSGIYIARQAITAVPESVVKNVSDTDQAKMVSVNLEYEALRQVQALISPYALGHPNSSIAAYNKAAEKSGLQPVEEPSETDQMTTSKSLQTAIGQMGPLISGNPDFQKELEGLREQFRKDIVGADDPAAVQKAYQSEVEKAARKVAEPAYAIGMKDKAIMLASSVAKNLSSSTNGFTKWFSELVTGTINPILLWILIRVSSLILEISMIVLIVVYPLWFLESTAKAFLQAANGFFGAAIFPAVAFVLLAILELIIANVGAPSFGNLLADFSIGMMFFSAQIFFLLIWIIGAIWILWKSPKITKKILEGGSIAGTLIGGAVTATVGAALASAGIASGAIALAPAAAGALGMGGAGAAANGAGAAIGAGSKALAGAGSSGAGAGSAGAGSTPTAGATADQANNAGKQTLQNSAKVADSPTTAKSTGGQAQLSGFEKQIADQRASAKSAKLQSTAEKVAMHLPADDDDSPALFTQTAGSPGSRPPVALISGAAAVMDRGAGVIKKGISAYRERPQSDGVSAPVESAPRSLKEQALAVAAKQNAKQTVKSKHDLRRSVQ